MTGPKIPGQVTSINEGKEADAFILELSGILSQAAAIKMDAGYKPANKVIATLRSIAKDPSVILDGGVEPEALAMVASNYQRSDEEPGTFWFDVDKSDDLPFQVPQRVSKAAAVAIGGLSARRGQPRNVMLDFLGDKLLACYMRFNGNGGRHSVAADGDGTQVESGPFFEFLTVVTVPLNRFLSAHHGAMALSVPVLAWRALQNRGKTRIQRSRTISVPPFSQITQFFP